MFCYARPCKLKQVSAMCKVLYFWGVRKRIPSLDPWFHRDFPVWVPFFESPEVAFLSMALWFKTELWLSQSFERRHPSSFRKSHSLLLLFLSPKFRSSCMPVISRGRVIVKFLLHRLSAINRLSSLVNHARLGVGGTWVLNSPNLPGLLHEWTKARCLT